MGDGASRRRDISKEKEGEDESKDPPGGTHEGESATAPSESANPAFGGRGHAGKTNASRRSKTGTAGNPDQLTAGGSVAYDPGPDHQALSERSGLEVGDREARRLQRLEAEFGSERVSRWADEGMTVRTMGKPRDMEAFRERQAERPEEVPTDVERRNEASLQRNTARSRDNGPAGDAGVPDVVREVVSSPGQSLDETVQRELEEKMGGDFGDVRIHTGPQAATAADAINARAFTVGNHVAFNRGEYQPERSGGQRLLAHELTHVRQQTEGAVSMLPKADAPLAINPEPKLEREAGETAQEVTAEPLSVRRMGTEMYVQPKLEVSSPGDPAEREAERITEEVMSMSDPSAVDGSLEVRRSVSAGGSGSSDGSTISEESERRIRSVQGGGKPLSEEARSFFEPRFGRDFSDVRVHTGTDADQAARSINATSFTMGSDIAFAKGNYDPDSTEGKQLLAHELTHVVQQGESKPRSSETIQRNNEDGEGGCEQAEEVSPFSLPSVTELDPWTQRMVRVALNAATGGWSERLSSIAQAAGVSIGVGLEGEGMAVGGGKGGYGIVYFPDGSIGAYGSVGGGLGASVSAEATMDVTVIGGGIEYFGGDIWYATFGGGMTVGAAGAISVLFEDDPRENPEQREVLGVSADVGIGASLTVVDAYVGYEDTNAAKLLGCPPRGASEPAEGTSGTGSGEVEGPSTEEEGEMIELEETKIEGNVYTVKRGDTLWEIAKSEYGDPTKWEKIANRNGIKRPKDLQIGTRLVIPPA